MIRSIFALCITIMCTHLARAQQPIEEIEVLGQTPLGAALQADQIAANVQSVTSAEIREQRALDLAEFMRRNLTSVFVNEAQSNPLQPDLQYRGFVGSPLLGLPQGIAVYQDGVRLNEPFGDTVNWALIPDSAIDSASLMPGSGSLFGRNALGGALSIRTKNGFTSSGASAEVFAGSFGRIGIQADAGSAISERFAWYVTGSRLEEDGWRDFSPTESAQVFGKASWRLPATSIDVSVNLADTDLIGNGAAPVELLALNREAVFTRPDQTENELAQINLNFESRVAGEWVLEGNVYSRSSNVSTYNGDDSDFEQCEDDPGFVCEEEDGEEEVVLDQDDQPVIASEDLEGATVNRTDTNQDGTGFGIQAIWNGSLAEHDNRFVAGLTWDQADIDFSASTELGTLDATRQALPGGIFVGESFTDLEAEAETASVFISNTFSVNERMSVTLSGRYNDTRVVLRDQLGTALNGDHSFSRFNPAAGLTVRLSDAANFYASYSESNRAPTPVELTCADPDDPCRLPNAFLADPPLEQVVAETLEFGLRGEWRGSSWNAGMFRTTNDDDILFISAGALTNQGFFDNVGRTRRQGVELGVQGEIRERYTWFTSLTSLEATFRESVSLPSPNNPAAVDGEVSVTAGDRLPLVPEQLFKAGLRAAVSERLTLAVNLIAGSDFYMRGDEGNDLERIGDYLVVNVRGDFAVSENVHVFLNVDNLLDQKYETFGLFGEPDEVLGDEFDDSRFLSPAAPRAAWLGLQVQF